MSIYVTSPVASPAADMRVTTPSNGLFSRAFRSALKAWQRHRMIAAFEAMDDRLLNDIGICRSEIRDVVNGFDARELRMVPLASAALVWAGYDEYQKAA